MLFPILQSGVHSWKVLQGGNAASGGLDVKNFNLIFYIENIVFSQRFGSMKRQTVTM